MSLLHHCTLEMFLTVVGIGALLILIATFTFDRLFNKYLKKPWLVGQQY